MPGQAGGVRVVVGQSHANERMLLLEVCCWGIDREVSRFSHATSQSLGRVVDHDFACAFVHSLPFAVGSRPTSR